MLAHTQHRFLVLANNTTLVVVGACAHGSASWLIGGCTRALLSTRALLKARQNGENVNPFGTIASVAGD